MKNTTSILFLVSLMVSFVFTSTANNELFESANNAYKEGNYVEAINNYESLVEDSRNAEVHYNLGNAYYKTGKFTRAILNYERALKLNPTDGDVQHNLDIANLNVIDKIDATPEFFLLTWWKAISLKLKADHWTILFIVLLWFSISCFLAFAFLNISFRKFLFVTGLTGILVSIVILLMAVTRHHFETRSDFAIIMSPSVSVKSAPLNSGTDLFIIHEGLKVLIIDSDGDWLKICLPDDKQGWMPGEMVEVI